MNTENPQGPELPLSNAVLLGQPKAKANPLQLKTIDNKDDRLEILTLLKHLPPRKRLAYFTWICSQAILPGTHNLHPGVAPSTVKLAETARHCDRANEQLTVDITLSLTCMWLNFSLDIKSCLTKLIDVVRRKS